MGSQTGVVGYYRHGTTSERVFDWGVVAHTDNGFLMAFEPPESGMRRQRCGSQAEHNKTANGLCML